MSMQSGRGRNRSPGFTNRAMVRDRSGSPPRRRGSPDYGGDGNNYGGSGGYNGPSRRGGRGGGGYNDDFRCDISPVCALSVCARVEFFKAVTREAVLSYGSEPMQARRGRPMDRGFDRGGPERFDRYRGERDRGYGGYGGRDLREREPYYGRQRDRGMSPSQAMPSPPYEGRGGRDDEPSKEPMSKVKFIKLKIPEDVPEKEADARYEEYLANFWSSRTRAEFEKKKNDDDFRRMFDPRVLKETIDQREKDAGTKAVQFKTEFTNGKCDWTNPDLEQLMTKEEMKKSMTMKSSPPPVAWLPEIIAASWTMALKLIVKLDEEKRIIHDALPWVEEYVRRQREEAFAKQNDEMDHDGEEKEKEGEGAENAAEGENKDSEKGKDKDKEADGDKDDDGEEMLEGEELETKTGQLDVMLEYLWKVHSLDFYSGAELDIDLYQSPENEPRTVRSRKPKTGTGIDERKRGTIKADFHRNVTSLWKARLHTLDVDSQRFAELEAKVDAKVEATVKQRVQKQEDAKNGPSFKCAFCNKKFKGELYVVKHMYARHPPEVSEIKNAEYETLYFENFKAAKEQEKEEEDAPQDMEAEYRGGMAWPHMGMGMGPGPMMGMMPGMMGMMPMPGMIPGHGPPMMGIMPPPHGPPFGGRGFGGRGMGRGGRRQYEYFDLDDPGNARQILDYGEI